ncbi:MAG: hypothetical protein R2716_09990 [Microthrixaceae bacterium]
MSPWMIPARRNPTRRTAPRLRTATNGESDPANHEAVMFGRAEVFRKLRTPSIGAANASSTHRAMPAAT